MNHIYIKKCYIFLLTTLMLLCVPALAVANGLELSNFVLHNQDDKVIIRYSLALDKRALDRVKQELQQGARMELTCKGSLYQSRDYWSAKALSSALTIGHLKANPAEQEFILTYEGGDTVLRNKDLNALLKESWGQMGMRLAPFSLLRRGNKYFIDLSVELKYEDVSAWKRYTFFFKTWAVVPGARYQMDFDY